MVLLGRIGLGRCGAPFSLFRACSRRLRAGLRRRVFVVVTVVRAGLLSGWPGGEAGEGLTAAFAGSGRQALGGAAGVLGNPFL